MLVALRRPETHVIKRLVSSGAAYRLESRRVVHVDLWRLEALFGVIDDVCLAEGAFIEFIDVACVEMLSHVEHLISLLNTRECRFDYYYFI